ncbi:MAG TPA: gephyrin-like molybdotransferase Glp [Candidatus Baltobacteraceae bacterium]|jgi:molybdopterin molybdotransferase|nr:gephyrin-like molybdotransferase Glp [Candidatus Baltobacteraceae bacterium]
MKVSRITPAKSALLPGAGFDTGALLAPEQALSLYFACAALPAPALERVPLALARGRILSGDAVADVDYPAAPRSAMDGFALRSADAPGRLAIAGAVGMGTVWTGPLPPRSAVRIPTGGVLPQDADTVVPIEDVHESDDSITVDRPVPPGDAVTPAGSDMKRGEKILQSGRRIGAAEMGVLATLGMTSVPVFRVPVVAVISSGDELVEAGTQPQPGQIRDSNRWAVGAALQSFGLDAMHLPTAPDEPGQLESAIRDGLAAADGVVLTGGSSVGAKDLTPAIIDGLGEPGVIVHGLRVKPGKPTVLASIGGKPVIGLPGNPTSALMILQAVVAPILAQMLGTRSLPAQFEARLDRDLRKRTGWTWFIPVRFDESATAAVEPLEMRSSMVSLLARANGFITVDESIEVLAAGDTVRVTRFM